MRIIGHGVDIVEVARIRRSLEEHGERFLGRVFTAGERAYAVGRARRDEHLAARFAAKEAVMKALGTGWGEGVGWTDVEVELDASGRPGVRLHGRAGMTAAARGIDAWTISLSHTESYAVASVIALGE
jgi:holo-[acyl-carrier protein] synthase